MVVMSVMVSSVWLGILIVFLGVAVSGQLQEGDTCKSKAGIDGTCRLISDCPSALDDLKKGILSAECGYKGTQSVICCVARLVLSNVRPAPGDRAAAMCKEYSKYAYEEAYSQEFSLNSVRNKTLKCPINPIGRGTMAGRKEFPHMVHLGFIYENNTDWLCGGSLISPTFVLTAGHCLSSPLHGDVKLVRGGITNLNDIIHLQIRKVVEAIKYPDYNFVKKYHDIALLRLDEYFDLNTYLRPACLYTQKSILYITAVASGWGVINYPYGVTSQDLLKVTLESFNTTHCNNTYQRIINKNNSVLPMGIVEDLMMCYGSAETQDDTCQGDTGGPLQIVHPETINVKCMYDVIGVISYGISCGISNSPGIYTRVSHYIDWIENIVWPI